MVKSVTPSSLIKIKLNSFPEWKNNRFLKHTNFFRKTLQTHLFRTKCKKKSCNIPNQYICTWPTSYEFLEHTHPAKEKTNCNQQKRMLTAQTVKMPPPPPPAPPATTTTTTYNYNNNIIAPPRHHCQGTKGTCDFNLDKISRVPPWRWLRLKWLPSIFQRWFQGLPRT